ncbi:elongation of very long chain fatty acids protein AAEL008004 isoform X1 [Drosophila innubila]|uniref:elongation of very long chain fatty acids protein AAEL008004 isoform X1 n=1 Tax=Drosophila innubila TaxID=198719 RepID=UPI00148D10FE|nr:elongation of very long chain fatty acids protein AAEL008004 isoform X1 [Drosophila innubila]XP_034488011.1 elongation of very long chain fatty acids protein AAEL008004 isoform X1 [Drosophila innubila]XP_034488012.1 elongation of very long chain fatty acids protein AAEL008004 isoform X1 [Drosophila innubila]XP_034488013.1 elongation of very long chain fatty acids protein AAEL008004 isoform X1 [Drosophila innubila]
MALIMKIYESINRYMDSHSDSRTKDWPMMSSPFPTLAVCLTYVYLVKVLGPRLMENRKPLHLQNMLVMYNALQVVFSAWLFYEIGISGWLTGHYSFRCQPVDYSNNPRTLRMVHACWWYYFSKFTEFMDTIFFVLRKKTSQVTTLHVIHHGCMPMSVWFGVKFTPGGHSTFFGLLNTFVHIVMYTYYMFSAMGPQYQKYLWWKKYLTTLQMVQFILIMVHAFQLLFIDCNYPKAFVWWIGMHAVMFFFLFNEFYKAAYRNRLMKKNALLANGHANAIANAKPNGYCKSINAHDDLFMPQPTAAAAATTATTTDKANGSATLTNGHANGLKNGYKPLANGNGNVNASPMENGGSVHSKTKLSNGYGNGNVNGYATKLLDDVSQELTHRKTPK